MISYTFLILHLLYSLFVAVIVDNLARAQSTSDIAEYDDKSKAKGKVFNKMISHDTLNDAVGYEEWHGLG